MTKSTKALLHALATGNVPLVKALSALDAALHGHLARVQRKHGRCHGAKAFHERK